jgi:hypothetical protein
LGFRLALGERLAEPHLSAAKTLSAAKLKSVFATFFRLIKIRCNRELDSAQVAVTRQMAGSQQGDPQLFFASLSRLSRFALLFAARLGALAVAFDYALSASWIKPIARLGAFGKVFNGAGEHPLASWALLGSWEGHAFGLISLLASLPSFHAKAIVARVTVWHKAGSAKLALMEKFFGQWKRFTARLANAGGCGIMGHDFSSSKATVHAGDRRKRLPGFFVSFADPNYTTFRHQPMLQGAC